MSKSHNEVLKVVKAKDIQNFCSVSAPTSFLMYKDIKDNYKIKRVTLYHLYDFLKIPILNKS